MIHFNWARSAGIGLVACCSLFPLGAQSKPAPKPADQIAQSRAALMRAFISLQKALGGGWQGVLETQ